jgi:hypothetical protein
MVTARVVHVTVTVKQEWHTKIVFGCRFLVLETPLSGNENVKYAPLPKELESQAGHLQLRLISSHCNKLGPMSNV